MGGFAGAAESCDSLDAIAGAGVGAGTGTGTRVLETVAPAAAFDVASRCGGGSRQPPSK